MEEDDLVLRLESAAEDIADQGGLGPMPHPARRAFVDALQRVLDAGLSLPEVTMRLSSVRPRDFLVLDEPVRTLLTSQDGLGIAEADIPQDAMDYLSLLLFLRREMEEGNLPYHMFDEMNRAAQEGLPLSQGLARKDRERLVRRVIEPELRRIWPRNPERVAEEVARLLE